MDDLRRNIAQDKRRKAQIKQERAAVLRDYKTGYFCSTCGLAKSEFASDAIFWQHIAEDASEGRHAVPATAQQTAAKEAEYKSKLAAVDLRIQQAQRSIADHELENRDGLDQLREGVGLWQAATEMEQLLLRVAEDAAGTRDKKDLADAQREIARLTTKRKSAFGAGDRDTIASIDDALSVWQQVESRT
jgi:hypothetical protein